MAGPDAVRDITAAGQYAAPVIIAVMEITTIDPRDQSWEVDRPDYRVYFFDSGASIEYELRGADVPEVLRWAETQCRGRLFVIYVCVRTGGGLGLVRLFGTDPTKKH